jgi:hypothetical protein
VNSVPLPSKPETDAAPLPDRVVGKDDVNVVPLSVSLVDEGATPAPPPFTSALAVSAAELAHVLAPEKYGMPPLVPATVNAGVVVGVATEIRPPVKETLVTVPPDPVALIVNP